MIMRLMAEHKIYFKQFVKKRFPFYIEEDQKNPFTNCGVCRNCGYQTDFAGEV